MTSKSKGKIKSMGEASLIETTTIKWNRDELDKLCDMLSFDQEWGLEFPSPGMTAADPPDGKISLYAAFFIYCNLRLPITRFIAQLLTFYQVYISQMHPMGICRATHFEFSCRALGVEPTCGRFNVFYKMVLRDSWFSFVGREGKVKSHITKAPSSFHEWKERFFYVKRDVIPLVMNVRSATDSFFEPALESFEGQDWYVALAANPAEIKTLRESALVAVGMSRVWKFPDRVPHYAIGYRVDRVYGILFNKPDGRMAWSELASSEPSVLERWKDNFLHPRSMDSDFSHPDTSGLVLVINPRPLNSVSSAGETFVMLSSDESSSSSDECGEGSGSAKHKRLALKSKSPSDDKMMHSPRGKRPKLSDSLKKAEEAALVNEPVFPKPVAVEKSGVTHVSPIEPVRPTEPDKVIPSPVDPSVVAGVDQGSKVISAGTAKGPPPTERLFQRHRPRSQLRDQVVTNVVGTLSCVSEMVHDWKLLCSENREFELSKREFERMKRELEDSRSGVERVRKLKWDLSSSREEAARELHQKAAADRKTACEQGNAKLAKAVDVGKLATSRVSALEGENKGLVERLALRDTEVVTRDNEIARLRAQLKEISNAKDNESAHRVVLESEVQALRADRRWLVSECIPHVVELVKDSPEFQLGYSQLLSANKFLGRQHGFDEGYRFAEEGLPKTSFELYDVNCQEGLDEKISEFDNLSFGILKDVTDCAYHPDLSGLKAILVGKDDEVGPSRREEEVPDSDHSNGEGSMSGVGDGDGDAKA
ncbi:hypothetical protein L1987_41332 [Smallanthus sonchifolius]|uniref:Uncharacterized protein n=1 Tax=Smallanthus sonchifolius TaxID=185202 RepID=A0ACB9GVK4_9ASTR|nr:hypothetical protein L1987_41332 [Smallanthus sonchifolius]